VHGPSIGLLKKKEEEEQTNSNSNDNSGSGCTTAPASEPGWTIEICNGQQTYISPSGARCDYNAESTKMACDDMQVMKGLGNVHE